MSTFSSAAFVLAVLALAMLGAGWAAAVYALSFWHYLLYALAYAFGAVPHAVFKRDAILMKGAALAAFAFAYFAAPIDPLSLAVSAIGFLLNAAGARALGADRTYYGHEVAGLPPARITAFPYSTIPHPMLLGNVIAFGGTLLNAGFREAWWPLAVVHAGLNLGLIGMEISVTPLRGRPGPSAPAIGTGICIASLACLGATGPAVTILAAGAFAYAWTLHRCYAAPVSETRAKGPP